MTENSRPVPGQSELEGQAPDFISSEGRDLLLRWERHRAWWDARLACGLDPSLRTVLDRGGTEAHGLTRGREPVAGINLATRDCLALAAHPLVRAAAIEAAGRWGIHAAGPLSRQGRSPPLVNLEERIAEILCCPEATIFSTDWAAGYSVVRILAQPLDHVIIDAAAGQALHEGAVAATPHVIRLDQFDPAAVTGCLSRIRSTDSECGILVAAGTYAPLQARVTEMAAIHTQCRAFGAMLLADVAEDFGAVGDGGLGFLGAQGMVGEVDIVVGTLANSLASNGGFVASAVPGLREALAVFASPVSCSHALAPPQAAAALAALEIVHSAEGARRRARLMDNVVRLRTGLAARALTVPGQAGTSVPVMFGASAEARLMTREVLRRGALVDLHEQPDVSPVGPRWLLHVMTDHTSDQLDRFVSIVAEACDAARVDE